MRKLLLAMVAILFAVGCVMDLSPIILILTPVLLPVAKQAGINEIYFGVIFIVCGSIGLITPPVGTVLNVVAGATKSSMTQVVRGVAPFLLSHSLVLLLKDDSAQNTSGDRGDLLGSHKPSGETTSAVPARSSAGSWKHSDLPPPVGMRTSASPPPATCETISCWAPRNAAWPKTLCRSRRGCSAS